MEVKSRVEDSRLPVRGIAWGVAAVLAWALYNVGAKLGVAQGFQSQDLTLMRYGVAGLLMLPLILRSGLGSLGWGRGLMLTLCVGPLFGLVVNTGFVLAPLAHGVVLPPAATMISTTLLAWGFAGERPKVAQLIGIVILLTGLVAIAWDGLNAGTGQAVWLGDLAFIAAGTMWGTFTTLLKRWRVDAVSATAIVSVISMVVFVPGYLIIYGLPQLPAQALASQAVFQGLFGGWLRRDRLWNDCHQPGSRSRGPVSGSGARGGNVDRCAATRTSARRVSIRRHPALKPGSSHRIRPVISGTERQSLRD